MDNDNYSVIVVGRQRCGKTTYANRLALAHEGRVLCVQPDDRRDIFSQYPDLFDPPDESKIRRAIYQPKLDRILDTFSDGLLILDDCARYVKKYDDKWGDLVRRKRQYNKDIIFVVHSLFDFPPNLMQYINGIYVFPFHEPEDRIRGRVENWDEFRKVWSEVNKFGKPKYYYIFA